MLFARLGSQIEFVWETKPLGVSNGREALLDIVPLSALEEWEVEEKP